MQSGRHQDYRTMPTSSRLQNQTGRRELINDPYQISPRDAPDRAPRSLSPRKANGSRRFLDGHRISDSTDRRDYRFRLSGGRSEGVHSKSPQYGLSHRRDPFEDGVVRRKYRYLEVGDFDHGANQSTSRASKERGYGENKVVDIGSHGILNQKSIPLEEDAIRGLYHLPSDINPTKNYVETSGSLPLPSPSMDVGGVEHERLQYRQPIPSDKLAATESYKEEKHGYHSRDRQPIPSDKLAAMEYYKEEKHGYHSRDRQPIPSDKLAAMEYYKQEKHGYHSRDHQPNPSDRLAAMESYKEEKHVYHSKDKLPVQESYRGEKPVYHSRDKLPIMESYREGEKPIYHSRDILYPTVPSSHSKDILSTSQYKDFVSTSAVASMSEFSVSYGDGVILPASDGYSRSGVQLTEPIGFSSYGQRSYVDTTRDAEAEPRNFIYKYNQRGAYDSSRTECEDFVYPKTTVITSDDQGYPSDYVHRVTSPRIRDYNHDPMDYDLRDLPRPRNILDRIDNSEHSCGDFRKRNVLDHPTLQKQAVSDYLDMSRKSYALKQGGDYLNSASNRAEFARRVPQDYGVSQDHQISYMRSDYGYGRDAGQIVHKERYQSTSDPLCDAEAQKIAVRTHRIEEELGIREQSGKVLKRKNLDDDINQHDSRTIMSRKWHLPANFEDLYDSDECFDEGMSGVHLSKTRRFNHNEYRKGGRAYNGQEHYGDFASGDRFSTRDSLVHSQGSSIRYYQNSGKYVKANPKFGSLSRHKSHHVDRRTGLNKQHKVWKRIEDYNDDVHENDGDTSEEWSHLADTEPCEDTEEFTELVQKAFLLYSKKLNANPSVRRRYREQGKAGSLFCIACGRSLSKEFMNTQSLVRHAFMSHKVGLRALHLGLQKAICVLMGWNSVVPHDMITWVPEVLHDAEAMAQKEDLILWPPVVVIHNISMSNKNPKEQKVVPIEGVEAFIRGKGFVGGKITVCLGRPADQSVMVAKFLGTFNLDLSNNKITALPSDLWSLGSLKSLNLSYNQISGSLPSNIGNFGLVEVIDLSNNNFSGEIPAAISSLVSLRILKLDRNMFQLSIPPGLLNCRSLVTIDLSVNQLNGSLPDRFGTAFPKLKSLNLAGNEIYGRDTDLGGLKSITSLNISGNLFQGSVMGVFLESLEVIDLSRNQFQGHISQVQFNSGYNWSHLVYLDLSENQLSGEIFHNLSQAQNLKHLSLAYNRFTRQEFPQIGMFSELDYLNLSRTSLIGHIPGEILQLSSLHTLDLSMNHLSGQILIPSAKNLGIIDMSHNNLSGEIPVSLLANLHSMERFNFSYNNLTLCASELSPEILQTAFFGASNDCPIAANPAFFKRKVAKHKGLKLALALTLSMICLLVGLLFLAFGCRRKPKRWVVKQTSYKEEQSVSGPFSFQTDSTTWVADVKHANSVQVVIFEKPLLNITFADLLSATSNFDRGTLLAEGKFGPVYRGFLAGGIHVAVKVLVHGSTLTDQEAARELEYLGRIKHPNLVPLTGYCIAGDQRIAIYDYMENGNLQNLLHDLPLGVQTTEDWSTDTWEEDGTNGIQNVGSEGLLTTWRFRHKIALGTARALAFLHHGCSPPIIHRDIKASSVYLDLNLEPRLSDFGLAKIFGNGLDDEIARGSPGYMPPEFSQPDCDSPTPKSDVYCYGVVLFELITGKKPVGDDYPDEKEGKLVSWVRGLVRKNQGSRAIDSKIRDTGPEKQMEEALKIGYLCTADLPSKRPSMQQIVGLLKDIESTTWQ